MVYYCLEASDISFGFCFFEEAKCRISFSRLLLPTLELAFAHKAGIYRSHQHHQSRMFYRGRGQQALHLF